MLSDCPSISKWHDDVPRSARLPTILGFSILAFGVFGFGSWAGLAPLDGAVVASGSFVATGQNKQVQHLEGGLVEKVHVREGQLVEAGQILLQLDATPAKAKLRRLRLKYDRLIVLRAGLDAEIRQTPFVDLPPEILSGSKDQEVQTIFERMKIELAARRAKTEGEQTVYRKEIASIEETIAGYESQAKATRERLRLFETELADKASLLQRQLVRKTEVLSLQRAEAGLSGELGEMTGRIADSRERIARANQQIVQVRSAAIQKAVEELRQVEGEISDIQEQFRAADDIVQRTDVKALVRGIVVKLNHHTAGGVVAPGSVILELLPVNEKLIIEARVSPSDVVHVAEGQEALVRLSALNQRSTPMIKGRIIYLSADTISESEARSIEASSNSKKSSYIVRVRLDDADANSKIDKFIPTPGMPADIFIKTGERTFFSYIMKPVFESFSKAFREQ